MAKITNLKDEVLKLSREEQDIFQSLFDVKVSQGEMKVPEDMQGWVEDQFGSVEKVENQEIVQVTNKHTGEAALFNELRAERPLQRGETATQEEVEEARGGPFCKAENMTPEDTFGRIEGEHCVTASNVAKYDQCHGLIVFDEHNPLGFGEEEVVDYIRTGRRWFEEAGKHSQADYPMLLWHCLWRSAASIVHGHMQLLLTAENHYPTVKSLNQARQEYMEECGREYFQDLFRAHEAVGLGVQEGEVEVMASLTPRKEKEIMIVAPELNENFARALYKAVSTLRDDLGVESFTAGVGLPPLKQEEGWKGFPVVARVIDRGSLSDKTYDIGAMELFAGANVVASDPFEVFESLQKRF